ncbi:HAD family hydrolase [Carnobacterium sp.]|uniref:HAD family hydrolase n=1 Tax=Carnobacterium sp. TaxID=48221 RepID=UPI002FCBDE6B
MKKYLICSDIDGTLLDANHTVPVATKELFKTLLDAGHLIYLATGRMYRSGQEIALTIDPRVQTIASNGSIYFLEDKLIQQTLPVEAVEQVYQIAEEFKLPLYFFSAQTVYYSAILPQYFTDKSDQDRIGNERENPFISIAKSADFQETKSNYLNGIFISEDPDLDLTHIKEKLRKIEGLSISSSHSNNIEIVAAGISKKTAILDIQNAYTIEKAQTICFGDGENDLEMFEIADTSVAMENASQLVQSKANFITSSNHENGLLAFLVNFLKKEGIL